VVILDGAMPRRLAVSLLCSAFVLAGVMAGPCPGNAACALASARQTDCCKGPPIGISAPRCCAGGQEIGGRTAPATPERPAHSRLVAPATQLAPAAVAVIEPAPIVIPQRIDPGAAPPGGTLIAQHTSLLL
jgi:hypothetical protein